MINTCMWTYMSGEVIEADHHNEYHNCHCELGGNHVRARKKTNKKTIS